MRKKEYVVIVQCHIVKERCSGYYCEYAFHERTGCFSNYPKESKLRLLTMTCGGCCGRGILRKLTGLLRKIKLREKIEKEKIQVHLSSCIAFESFHGMPCPHKKYIETLISNKLGFDCTDGSRISELTEKRRKNGLYKKR